MKIITDKKVLIKEFIQKNPNLNATETLRQLKGTELRIRKTDFLKIFREAKNLPEPTIAKREASIPVKHRTSKQKASIQARVRATKIKPVKRKPTKQLKLPSDIPFEKTKFGKMVKKTQNKHGLSEKKAIIRVRALLKIPKIDFNKLNQKDKDILEFFGY